MECSCAQCLCEYICELLLSREPMHAAVFASYRLPDEVVTDVDVLGAVVMQVIGTDLNGRLIVHEYVMRNAVG